MQLSNAPFYAPLKTSLALTNGSGVASFARATSATMFDNTNKLVTVPSGTPRFAGARFDGVNFYDTDSGGSAIPDSVLLGYLGNSSARTNNLLWCRDLTKSIWASNTQGAEILTNPNFDSNITGWSNGSDAGGSISWNPSGYINLTAGSPASTNKAIAYQAVTLVVSEWYTLTFDRVNACRVDVSTALGSGYIYQSATEAGTLSITFKASATTIYISLVNWGTVGTVSVNSVSLKSATVNRTLNQVGIDNLGNSATLLTATANDATVLQTITAAAAAACSSFYVKRSAGSGSVYFTRDGGVSWTDITSLINSSTFTRVKIENTSVTNPQVGFKIAASGDAIIVDYGQNEAGLQISMPILTASAAATRNADSLTYQTASNFSDTAGTIVATVKRDDWSASNGVVVGSATTGLQTRASTSGIQIADGTNTALGPTGTPSGSIKFGGRYSGVTMAVAANGVIGSNGTYDGSFNLANIAIMPATHGYIRDVAIWQTALSDNDLISVTSVDIAGHIAKLIASSVSCRLLKLSAYNGKGATQFIQLHDAASLPANGSVPKVTLIMQSKSNIKLGYDLAGRNFENGIVICNSLTQETLTLGNNDLLIEEPIIEPAMH